jgi:hypothetical protein
MWRPVSIAAAAVVLIACGGSPEESQPPAQQAPPDPRDTALLDATQAPLDRARAVQDTADDHAAKLDAQTREALGRPAAAGDERSTDPDAEEKDD